MKRSHLQLAAAHDLEEWDVLWQAALPLVKLVVGRLVAAGAGRTDDLLQEGYLAAGEAIRTWKPLECTLSTHVCHAIRSALYKHRVVEGNHGVGTKHDTATVLSLGDARRGAGAADEDVDPEDDGTFEAALTYEGVVEPGGQFDGRGEPPEGYGEPGEEAQRQRDEQALQAAADRLPPEHRDLVPVVAGAETQAAYAERKGIPLRTVKRQIQQLKIKMARFFLNRTH